MPVSALPGAWQRDPDASISTQPGTRQRDVEAPAQAQTGTRRREIEAPAPPAPGTRRREIDVPAQTQPGIRPRDVEAPAQTQPGTRRRDIEEATPAQTGTRPRDIESLVPPPPGTLQRNGDMPVSAQPATWQRDDDMPASARPASWEQDVDPPPRRRPAELTSRPVSARPAQWEDDDRPVSAQPEQWDREDDVRPRSAQPAQWERDDEPPTQPISAQPARQRDDETPTRPVSSQPGAWRAEAQAEARVDAWRSQLRKEQGETAATEDAQTEVWQREPWQESERNGTARGSATYRGGSAGDGWRQELNAGTELADGESRRFGTSDFVPFRPPSKNGASASAKVPAASSASEGATAVIPRTGARWQDPPDTQWPPRGAVVSSAGTYERRPVSTLPAPSARQNDLLEPDEEIEESTGGPLAAVGYTVVWYGVPVVLFVLYMLVLNRTQQAQALSTLASAAPQFGLSLVLSMLVAVGLRWASGSWKAASVGLAAAVMGGGLATVLASAITGQSLS